MKLKNLAGAFLALAGLAFGGVASAGDDSAIYSIHPLDEAGSILPPSVPFLQGGDTARFVVRLRAPGEDAKPYRLKHVGLGSYAEDWVTRRPKIGIFVSGRFQTATLESWAPTFDNYFTDFIFSYTVQPGDFELPIRLADSTKKMITDSGATASTYWLDFINDTVYAPAWTVDNSTETDAATAVATFQYATTLYHQPGDDSVLYRENYDFTKCSFNVKTVDFDDNDETATYWRTVHEGSTQTGGADPMLAVEGVPTNSTTLYVWSMDESAAKIVFDAAIAPKVKVSTKAIHVASPTATENREVAEIKVLAGEQIYPFAILGVARNKEATFVMSATPDFNYDKSFATPVRLPDYTTVRVACTEPLPASVRIAPALSRVIATSTSHREKVTELSVSFSEPFGEDVNVEIVTGFTDGTAPAPWSDYVRFSAKADEDVTLQKNPATNAFVVIPAGERKPTRFADGTPIVDGKIYVYALRSDDWSNGAKGTLTLGVRTDNANASRPSTDGGIDGWMNPPQSKDPQSALTVAAQDPVILQPEEGDDSSKTYQGSDCTFKIAVSDDWADMTNAFKVSVWKNTEDAGDNWKELEDDYFADRKSGLLYTTNGVLPKVKYDNLGENKTSIKVKSVLSGNESEPRNIVVTVLVAKGYTVATVDDVYEFDEGTATQVKIVFDDVVPDDCYAYLKGYSAADTNVLNCSWIAGPGGVGELIKAGQTELSGLALQITDGDASKLGSTFKYEVVLLTSATWSDDESKAYTKFKAKNVLQFKTHNVVPTVKNVTPNGKVAKRVTEGKTISGAFPLSGTVTNTFTVAVNEPGDYDKTVGTEGKRFETTWVFYNEDDGDSDHYPLEAPEDGIIYGNPDTNVCTVVFDEDEGWSAGHYRVEVWTKDKDMSQASEDTVFTFYLDVIDNPMVTVETPSEGYREQDAYEYCGDARAQMKLTLSLNECNFEMFAKLTVKPNNGSDNPGCLELVTNETDVVWLEEGVYKVRIPKKATGVDLTVNRMDGTRDSTLSGFAIEVEIPKEWNSKSKVPNSGNLYPYEYYVADENIRPAKVRNDKPVVDPEIDLDPAPSTNVYLVAAGLWEQTIRWAFNDVTPDFERPVQGGVTVTITGGGGRFETNCTSYAEALAVGQTGFTPNFSGKSGRQEVGLTVKDHDGGTTETFKWYFEVEDAKGMALVAHGPATGYGAALSKRYRTAAGLGEGRVWASSDSEIAVSSFESTVNCGKASTWKIYGYGYKVGDTDDGGNLHWPDGFGGYTVGYYTDRDTPISKSGSHLARGGDPDAYYAYAAPTDANGNPCDSFLYTWLQLVTNDKGSSGSQSMTTDSYLNNATAPEYAGTSANHMTDSGSPITLPTEKAKDGTGYSQTFVEAVFSREYLASDNMGDINQDGIPDVYVDKYGMGVVDTTTGQVSGDDLTKLAGFNEDEDYLPASDTGTYSALIPGLPASWSSVGQPFTAKLEIRGYGEALNDATENNPYTKVVGVVPDRVYLDPAANALSTLTPVEYMAWREWAAAHGIADPDDKANWTKWSPERPTDPTMIDTDEDGFSDGYEYYFWYRAHVGYVDGGVHRYLTGRAYDPRNPGEGTFIAAATIADLMDPAAPSGDEESAKTRDTDNDGLPDLLEFEIGTNPFDFDTDGDGLPDGFEIMLGGTDPLLAETTKGVNDAMRNYDGDAMAFTAPFFEQSGVMQPKPLHTDDLYKFALIDPDGDTDGIQWYVSKDVPTNLVVEADGQRGTSFKVGDITYVTRGTVPVVTNVTSGLLTVTNLVLAADLAKESTWTTLATNKAPEGVEVTAGLIALMPTRIAAGTAVTGIAADATYATLAFAADVTNRINAAWVYGRNYGHDVADTTAAIDTSANVGGFGQLAIGRPQKAPKGMRLAALPEKDEFIAYLHWFVYQEFGFDPRTAWNANTPLAPRWGKTVTTDGKTETVPNAVGGGYGYAGYPARTREYTLYDEFLVLSFFLNSGVIVEADVTPTQANPWNTIWSLYTTNGQGPNEPNWEEGNEHFKGRTAESNSGENGCDTDQDGVPDGWELYVMAGPAATGRYRTGISLLNCGPYRNPFSPFVADAGKAGVTDNTGATSGDGDDLTELQEFAGTDSCGYYNGYDGTEGFTVYSTGDKAIHRPEEHKEWLNKFFPTDPWNKDTDGDGLTDNEFATQGSFKCGNFHYGTPVDDGKMVAIPGGGLNPCTVDTDGDGLPDKWEAQFAGHTVYAGDDRQVMTGRDGTAGNPLQGLCDGMDGTVWDAYNSPRINNNGENYKVIYNYNGAGVDQVVDRDYDRDGLENWQEYMTGAMRAWRYDDPVTDWSYIPDDLYWAKDPETGAYVFSPDLAALAERTGEAVSSEAAFWYKTFFDTKSKLYNPHFVTGTSPSSQYFSRVTNGWDRAFTETGAYYMFYDRVNDTMIKDSWGFKAAPLKYICTSPIAADTDKDGMDDGYELFHGMNPILGAPGVLLDSNGPCDVVYDAWYAKPAGSPVDPLKNAWMDQPSMGKYDFVAHPWLNGIVDADPDGDDIRNQDEAIMPMVAPSTTWYHTDPTPLWMTDSSYGDSLVNRFFRLPIALGIVPVPESIVYGGKEYSLVDRDGFTWGKGLSEPPQYIAPFVPDFWQLSSSGAANWMYSFEENEGYDTDHDSGSDYEELQGKFRSATDPQDADSPRRRQAMHFGGPENPSALQTMPFVHEAYPRAAMGYPDDMSFLQYTVECWVRPESAADATVLERTSFTDPSHVADERYVRRNFAIMIRNGKWCTAFDSNGTLDGSVVEVIGKTDVKVGEWTFVAATFDANRLTLYVNGNEDGYVLSNLKPEYGSSAVVVYPAGSGSAKTNDLVDTSSGSLEALKGTAHAYWFDGQYSLNAFLIGASFANAKDGNHLDVTQGKGWKRYKDFFKGYVDEVRVWDGARSSSDIAEDVSSRKRYTREDALENRSSFYNQWVAGKLRYKKDGDGKDLDVLPELRFHWAFDSIPGAENAAAVAQAPHGFLEGDKPYYSRPEDYMIPWWSGIVDAYGSVYEGERNWVPWIPNTVTHLPRFDMTTLDSSYWSENYAGDAPGTYKFARTAEPISKWTQYVRNMTEKSLEFRTIGRRFWLSYNTGTNGTSTLDRQFEFTGRHLNQTGDDLLPLGGAFVKYVDSMWDEQGASSVWEQTGNDGDGDGLADWWQEYAEQNYREGVPEGEDITWNTMIWYEVGGVKIRMTAGEAYKRDLAKGAYVDANGEVRTGPTVYAQTAKSDGMVPDWWKELKKIDGEDPLSDLDNDGLNNYVEYVASELLPFRLNLDPRMAKSDTVTLDYFRKIGRLYLGEMLTDHDQMEDHWERSLGDESIASAALWDALKDGEEDGWVNFAENRYNGYAMSTLAQLVAHAMGDNEVLDAPIPSIRMKVRYNGDRPLSASSTGGEKNGGEGDTEKSDAAPALVVRAFSKSAETGDSVMNPDAVWTVTPGVTVTKEVYLGGWEDRVVRGTMAPGNVDIGTLDIKFAQVPQNDLYSWTDESGTHLAGTYKEFKEALDKNPDIIQNIQNFEWLSLYAPMNEYTSTDRAVTVTRDKLSQENAQIAVYGERVGTINLTTGDFEFDLGAMNRLRVNYTYDGSKTPAAAWSYKEAIFKITYTAKVPSSQLKEVDFSLAKADKGFVRSGDNSLEAFYDLNGNGAWDPGEPFGVVNDVEIDWAGRDVEIELTDMSAITPRVDLWTGASDRAVRVNVGSNGIDRYYSEIIPTVVVTSNGQQIVSRLIEYTNKVEFTTASVPDVHVTVSRYALDGQPVGRFGLQNSHLVVLERDFTEEARTYLHEGDFLTDGAIDIDWENFAAEVVEGPGVRSSYTEVTNVAYKVTFDWDSPVQVDVRDTNTVTKMLSTLITRRFEKTRTIPTPCSERSVHSEARPTFRWKIVGEDPWAAHFGTTYTGFKVRVKDLKGKTVYNSGVRRLPAKDAYGVYSWTAPLYVGEKAPGSDVVFQNLTDYTWEVALYNAKFATDDRTETYVRGNPFSKPEVFRMNVTELDTSTRSLAVRACYTGPAAGLLDCVRVQAFASPDFTGDPIAETTLRYVDIRDSLSPEGTDANVVLAGLPEGSYFLRAYIDTNGNGTHDEWESWGYLSERDQASKPGIFNPVALAAAYKPLKTNVRKLFIEDCDTDGDFFPDVWEAEQNGGVFVKFLRGDGQGPVDGDAELIGINPELKAVLEASKFPMLEALGSKNGLALISGIPPTRISTVERSDGTLGISIDNKVESVKVTGFDFTAEGNVRIKIEAATTSGSVDDGVTAFYGLSLTAEKKVTCKIYRKAKLSDTDWKLAGSSEVVVGGEPVTITVSKPVADNGGFYKAEIIEK